MNHWRISAVAAFSLMNRLRLCRIVIGITLVFIISACTAFDPLDSTGETFNRNTTDYANDAILMNIVRSKLYEL